MTVEQSGFGEEENRRTSGAKERALSVHPGGILDQIDLKRADMTRVIGRFMRDATNAQVALLFYAGHGVQINGKNYLLPVDGRTENGAELTVNMTDLHYPGVPWRSGPDQHPDPRRLPQ